MEEPIQRESPRLAIVSTYVPRRCGIATFARDLAQHYHACAGESQSYPVIVAMSHDRGGFPYPPEVCYEIRQDVPDDYRAAAAFLNRAPVHFVSLQHEYGIFGGEDGNLVLNLLSALKKPLITTLHTVLQNPTRGQRDTLKEIGERSSVLIVLSQSAIPILEAVYDIPAQKVVHIPHGAPDLPFSDPAFFQESLGLAGKKVIMTFGHLGPGKGIELMIEAMKRLAPKYPDLVYLVVGATHPELLRRYGEAYREGLVAQVREAGLQNCVRFVNKHLTDEEVREYLQAADIYVAPYPGAEQIASGPLAYAAAAGKAVIATPFLAAQELLADGRGILTPFGDPDALAENVERLLNDPVMTVKMRKAAYKFARSTTWEKVGARYYELCSKILWGEKPIQTGAPLAVMKNPEFRWDHLLTLIDSTGVIQHARYAIPDYDHGYTSDDNARALLVSCQQWRLNESEEALPLLFRTLSFLAHAYNPATGRIRNFMSYNRQWMEKSGSEDSHGRAIWAVGYAAAYAPRQSGQHLAFDLFQRLLVKVPGFTSPRAWAFALLGISSYLERFDGDLSVRRLGMLLADRLVEKFEQVSTRRWKWFEEVVTYDNARLPEALLSAYVWSQSPRYRNIGLQSLTWLFEACTAPEGHLSLIGCHGWWKKGKPRAKFDQQPVDAAAMVWAAVRAYEVTQDSVWREKAIQAYEWFLGRNDVGDPLVHFRSGGCCDGLTPLGVNENMGAESTLSWLLAQCAMQELTLKEELLPGGLAEAGETERLAASG